MYDKTGKEIDQRELLRIKAKSLAAEAAIIRVEEQRAASRRLTKAEKKELALLHEQAAASTVKEEAEALVARIEKLSKRRSRGMNFNPMYERMHQHRTRDLRLIARQTQIAYGFIRGKTLPQIEPRVINLLTSRDWEAIGKMVQKYGTPSTARVAGTSWNHFMEQAELYRNKQYTALDVKWGKIGFSSIELAKETAKA